MRLTFTRAEHVRDAAIRTPQLISIGRADLRNVGLLLFGFVLVLALVPPVRPYPINDDWIYFQSVGDLLRWAYKPHDWTQPIALGHLLWGALFSAVFGESFTILTVSNLVMSAMCLLLFYLLLRHLSVSREYALLGVAVLGLNPIYMYLTYSFMTDITFLVYLLVACLCYLHGIRSHSLGWLWAGGFAAAMAYLTRQYGILVVLAALGYLWWLRRWTWREAISIASLSVAVAALYAVWERGQPETLIALQMAQVNAKALGHPVEYALLRGQRITWLLPGLGLSLLPLLRFPRRNWLLVASAGFVLFLAVQGAYRYLGPFSVNGNIIDNTGLLMYNYNAASIWSPQIWTLLAIAGAVAFFLYSANLLEQGWQWLRSRPWRAANRAADPALLFYGLGLMLAAIICLLTPFIFDRYWLALLPMLILPAVRRTHVAADAAAPVPRSWGRWLALVPVALFSLLGQRDYVTHTTTRWQAAQSLVAQGIEPRHIKAGYEWEGWYAFQEGARVIRATKDLTYINYPPDAAIDPVYQVSDLPLDGYTQIGSVPYQSWLEGGLTRHVLLLKRK